MAANNSKPSRSLLPWKPSDWSLNGWETGRGANLLTMAGLRNLGLTYPKLSPKLPAAVGSASGGNGNTGRGGGAVPQKGALQTYARNLLAKYGWAGQWDSFNNIVMAESGWNPLATNPTSGAFGIAQALGHGDNATQGTNSSEYGGYGLTNSQARAANSGDGYDQILWMMNYIRDRYGSPDAAWAFHLNSGAY